MRTKTLLVAVTALAAGLFTSQAAVTSANVVGYANVVIPGGNALTLLSTPLVGSAGGAPTNGASEILTGLDQVNGGENLFVWFGTGYYVYTHAPGAQAAGAISDWEDSSGNIPGDVTFEGSPFAPEPQLAPGQGYFIQNPNGPETNTYAGVVVLSNTNSPTQLSGGNALVLVAPTAPVGGDLSTNSPIALEPALQGGENLFVWFGTGYYIYNYAPGAQAAGAISDWEDASGNIPGDVIFEGTPFAPAPQNSIGKGYFIQNPNGTELWTNTVVLQ